MNENEKLKTGAQCWATLWPTAFGTRLGPAAKTTQPAQAKTLRCAHARFGHRARAAAGGGSSVKVSMWRWREHLWSKGSTPNKLRQSGAHLIALAPMRR
jgi:hypothetical protein